MNYKFIELFVTFFNVGKTKFAPGTWGSLAAYPFLLVLGSIYILISIFFKSLQSPYIMMAVFTFILTIIFFIGSKFSQIYIEKNGKEDPKEIVIDEVVGQALILVSIIPINLPYFKTYSGFEYALYVFIMPFILFRLLDILKPWPISWFDSNIKGGIGVMLDDMIASLLAIILYYNIFYIIH